MFVSLKVSPACTIHEFQGLAAGPVDKGKLESSINIFALCGPDEKCHEGTSLGWLCTVV